MKKSKRTLIDELCSWIERINIMKMKYYKASCQCNPNQSCIFIFRTRTDISRDLLWKATKNSNSQAMTKE